MNPDSHSQAQQLIQQAMAALRRGDRTESRSLAERAAALDPDLEDPWLILAAVSDPKDSLGYLKHALEINPNSERARQGIHWAINRMRAPQTAHTQATPARPAEAAPPAENRPPVVLKTIPSEALAARRVSFLPVLLVLLLLSGGLVAWANSPAILKAFLPREAAAKPIARLAKPSLTPTPTATFTATPTFTPTPTATETPTPTPTFTPTATPTETPTPLPTNTPVPTRSVPTNEPAGIPTEVTGETRWIDIDLSQQMVYAYEGDEIVNSFLVSTGTWAHPTVTGEFHIYVKYRSATMKGPGYYLPDVPYVMYFYSGYGLHGTYWHSNFGTPMSHGCVNFRTEDAGWVFNWADVGTLVNIHN